MLEDARAVALGRQRQAERIVERMNVERAQIVDRVEVALAVQHRAHPLGRPAFDFAAEFAEQPDQADELVAVVGLGNVEPAVLRVDARHGILGDGIAHVVEAGLRQRPQILGLLEADAGDNPVGLGGKAGKHEPGVAARGACREAARLDERDRPAVAGELARRGEAGEPAADDADVDIEVFRKLRPLRRFHHGRGVPTSAIGRDIGSTHSGFMPLQLSIRRYWSSTLTPVSRL